MSSLLFVFGTIVEFAFVLVDKQQHEWKAIEFENLRKDSKVGRSNLQERNIMRSYSGKVSSNDEADCIVANEFLVSKKRNGVTRFSFFQNIPRSTKLDIIAFIIFNVCYIFFVVIYFLFNI